MPNREPSEVGKGAAPPHRIRRPAPLGWAVVTVSSDLDGAPRADLSSCPMCGTLVREAEPAGDDLLALKPCGCVVERAR